MIKVSSETALNLEMYLDHLKQSREDFIEGEVYEPDDVDKFLDQLLHQVAVARSKSSRTKIPEMILIQVEP